MWPYNSGAASWCLTLIPLCTPPFLSLGPSHRLIHTSFVLFCMHAKSFQLCLTLCDPMDCSPPGSSVQGIPQARILEWGVLLFSKGSSRPRERTHLRHWQAGSSPQVPPGKPWCFLGTQHPLWKALLSSHYPSVPPVSSSSLLIFKVPAKIFCLQLSFIQLFETRELHLLLYSSRYLLRVFIYRAHSPELWAPQGQGKYVLHLCGSTS